MLKLEPEEVEQEHRKLYLLTERCISLLKGSKTPTGKKFIIISDEESKILAKSGKRGLTVLAKLIEEKAKISGVRCTLLLGIEI